MILPACVHVCLCNLTTCSSAIKSQRQSFKFGYMLQEEWTDFCVDHSVAIIIHSGLPLVAPTSGSYIYNLLQAGIIDNAGAAEKPTPHTGQQKKQRIS